jgi:ABC-type multidrug transport system ATPase subunit
MISEENIKMGNKALVDEAEQIAGAARSKMQQVMDSLHLKEQALVLRDKAQHNPKLTAGIALALAGGIWAISRSVSASRRRKRTATKVLAAIGLWRVLTPLLRAARRKTPKLKKEGKKRFALASELLKDNAGPFFERTIPRMVKRFSH